MRLWRWLRFWYRRFRYGEFNEVTIPAIKGRPFPVLNAQMICDTQPMCKSQK